MPVVTLQSFKMIGHLEVGKLGRGPQILKLLNVFIRQMEPHVKWHFFGWKVFDFSCSRISRFPANFKKISERQIFDLSRDQTSLTAKISHFQNMANLTNEKG